MACGDFSATNWRENPQKNFTATKFGPLELCLTVLIFICSRGDGRSKDWYCLRVLLNRSDEDWSASFQSRGQ